MSAERPFKNTAQDTNIVLDMTSTGALRSCASTSCIAKCNGLTSLGSSLKPAHVVPVGCLHEALYCMLLPSPNGLAASHVLGDIIAIMLITHTH